MIENNNTVSKDLEKALQALEQAKQRVANEKKKQNEKKRKAENHHKYIMGGIVVKYFPDCYSYEWKRRLFGTVHTFQGKEADEVVFVLGCDEKAWNAAKWAGQKANILNVAVTRAKKRRLSSWTGSYGCGWDTLTYLRHPYRRFRKKKL